MKLTDADNAADGIFFPALEQNMMGAVLINENDEVMFFNPAAEKLWGYKREEVIGNNIDMLIPRDLRPAHPEYIRHNREGGKARVEGMSRELQLEKKDGSKIWTRFALSKVSAEGKVYYLALVRDASVEMAQKEQTRQLIIAVDHLDRPVIVLDPERHIVQCNRAFTEMFGYCISEASGMQPDTLLNIPEFPADNRIRLQQLLWKTARDQDEFLLLTRTGEKIWIKASISPVYDVLAHLQNLVMTFSDITEERQIRQLEGNILAAMCSSPPFHEMGEIICRNIESVLNESHVSLFALRNGMPIHWASSSHGAEIQNAQSWSATIRQRDGAPAGILQIKTSSGAETSAFIERVADISQHMAALALEQEKSRQHIEQLIQFDPMTGLPNRNNLHNYLDDLVDKAVSPVVYLIGVDHIQDVIDSLGYAWADQALLEVVNRFREKLKPDQYLCRIEGTQFVLVSLENDVSNITQIADELRKPNFKRVSVKIIGESASRRLQLSRGDIDIADALPVDQLNALKQENKVNVAEYPSLRVTYLYLNNSKAPLNQADLRRAISWSTDYQGMVNGILSGNGKQMRGPIPEGMWGYDATAMQYNHDETKAKAEWDKVTSKPTSLTFLYSDNDPNWEPIALATQSSLNKLGIIVKLEKLANATMRDRVGKGDYDIAIGNWSPDFADPYMFMNYWFESDKKGLPGNRSFYENSEVDKLLRNALATTDQTQRTRDYQQAQKIVIDDAAYVYLFQKNYQLAMNKEVKGFVFNPMLEQVFNINTMSK